MKMKYKAPEKEVCKVAVEGGDVRAIRSEDIGNADSAGAGN